MLAKIRTLSVVAIAGLGVTAGVLLYKRTDNAYHASLRMADSSCDQKASDKSPCKDADPVINLGRVVVTPTARELRLAEARVSTGQVPKTG